MNKSFRKNKIKLYKGVTFGAALLMCATFMPFNAVKMPATEPEAATTTQPVITLQGAPEKTVSKGKAYTVAKATFGANNAGNYVIGEDGENTALGVASSKVTATYKGTSDEEEINEGKFTPARVGTYVITYTVVATDGTEYRYEYEITCETSSAHFEFSAFEKNTLPYVYDLGLIESKKTGAIVNYPDVKLPLPIVYDENNLKVMDGDKDLPYYAETMTTDTSVVLTVVGGQNEELQVKGEGKDFYIEGKDIKDSGEGQYTITYTYYQGGQFVASTEKTFDVYSSYYKNKDNKPGYTLNTSFTGVSTPTSAVIGVKTELPAVKGVTATNDNPASDEVPVSYSIKIERNVNGRYEDVTSEALVKDEKENKYYFIPQEKGNYRISYDVTDFYGSPKSNAQTMQFTINDVKDTQPPVVYVYDANETYSKDADGNFISAENKFKSYTGDKNVVIYAIGATDNYKAASNKISLKRTIRSAGSANLMEITQYNDKNLIFNFTSFDEFTAANDVIKREMLKEKVDMSSETAVMNWLKGHGYLIVTNDSTKTEADGYAYFDHSFVGDTVAFTNQTYRIVYEATDSEKNSPAEKIVDIEINLNPTADQVAPKVNTVSGLQNAYLPTDKISFSAPTVTDAVDGRLETKVAYRYLGTTRAPIIEGSKNDADALLYYARIKGLVDEDWNTVLEGSSGNEKPVDLTPASGWFGLDAEDGKYNIDLKDKLASSAFVEIFVYAVDDSGNVGYYSKVMSISQIAEDDKAPVRVKVEGYNTTEVDHGAEVILPTITYTDANVAYMSARVYVYHIYKDGDVNKRELMDSYDMSPYADTQTGTYIVKAGAFRANYEGKYQVVVVASDSANNSTASYFEYTAGPFAVLENPVIDNIHAETINLEVGQSHNFASPTIAMSNSETYGYVGLDADGVTATYYNVKVNNSANASFNAGLYFFTSYKSGRYTVQYNVYLIRYNKAALEGKTASSPAAGGFYLDNGTLMMANGGTNYFVMVDTQASEPKLIANTAKDGSGTAYTGTITNSDTVSLYARQSPIQTIVVSDTTKPVITPGLLNGIRTYYPIAEGGRKIELPRISATEISEDGIDAENSYVSVNVVRPKISGSTTYTVNMNNWTKDSGVLKNIDGKLYLVLDKDADGTYTIKYHVADFSGNYDEVTKVVKYGDTVAPTLEIQDGFLNKKANEYRINKDQLILNVDKLTMSDLVTTDKNALLKTISIKVENIDTDTEIKNLSTVDVSSENPEDWVLNFKYDLKTAGEYKVTVTIKDEAGNTATQTINFTVATAKKNATNTYQVVGTVLIVLAALVLVGVVGYFIYSKVKLDKESKKRK